MKHLRYWCCAIGLLPLMLSAGLKAQNAGVASSDTQSTATAATSSPTAGNGVTPPAPTTSSSSPPNPPVGTMSTIVVTAPSAATAPPEGSILPNDQTVTSAYGTDLSVQDTPRNVTAVNSELLQSANISSLADFVKVTPQRLHDRSVRRRERTHDPGPIRGSLCQWHAAHDPQRRSAHQLQFR